MKIVSLYSGHDANITFYDSEKNKCHIIELERLVKKRYFRLHADNSQEEIFNILNKCQKIAEKFWGFDNDYDLVIGVDGYIHENILNRIFNSKNFLRVPNHHDCHAMSTYIQSPFKECLIFSYDGGGDNQFFNIYYAKDNNISLLETIPSDFGGGYLLSSSCVEEVSKLSKHHLSLAGKMMGICAYGIPDESKVQSFSEFYFDRDWVKLSQTTEYNLKNLNNPWSNVTENYFLTGQPSYDFAATAQKAYEEAFIKVFKQYTQKYNIKNICITGGGALNVVLNQRLKNEFDYNFFVAPNPNDCGLSLGAIFLMSPSDKKVNVTYNGLPILDKDNLNEFLVGRNYENFSYDIISQKLKQGKIGGVILNDSEVGPRALGNRSIICDPSYKNIKDILNFKVKFREWYRPFAPFCLETNADNFFTSKNFENFEFMGYAPLVKNEFVEKLPSITHIDKSSRLQTVNKNTNSFFYNLLLNFSKYSEIPVLLNTSFNIKGNPILSTYEDAFFVLDNTELDFLITENFIIYKK